MKDRLINILKKFPEQEIVVVGDIMLDEYIYGNVSRISPEAPVPVVCAKGDSFYELGGAANVASNISSLNGKVSIFSFIGNDRNSEILKQLLRARNIDYHLDLNSLTTHKLRIIGNSQQLVRVDYEETSDKIFPSETKKFLLERADQANMILISDYAKGAITQDLMDFLQDYKKKIIIGPKPKNKSLYQGAYLIVPNEKEALEMSGHSDVEGAAIKLRQELNSDILITRGEKGMLLFADRQIEIPTYAKEVYDVSGAGDTVIATLSLALSSGSSLEEAAILANNAAGISVEKRGTYPVSLNELESRILYEERKIVDFNELRKITGDLKRKNRRTVWTNGCFDIFHLGHKRYLEEARKQGDVLIVGVDSDDSVKRLKGPGRPVNSENDRAEILAGMGFIDYVTIFPYGSVENYLRSLKPDVYVKGGDYTIDTINQQERRIIESYGGKIILIPKVEGKSTTTTIEKIKSNQ